MNSKTAIYIGVLVGTTVGSYIPAIWGDSVFSMWSVILGAIGGIAGIYIGFKLSS